MQPDGGARGAPALQDWRRHLGWNLLLPEQLEDCGVDLRAQTPTTAVH